MAEYLLPVAVLDVLCQITDNPGDINALLNAARSALDETDAQLGEAEAQLSHIRHEIGEVMAAPTMTLEQREDSLTAIQEAFSDTRESVYRFLEKRMEMRQIIKLLLFLRALAIGRRAFRLLPAVALAAMNVLAAVLIYGEWRRGVVPASTTLGRILTLVTCLFLERYRVRL